MVYELPHILVRAEPMTDRYQRRGGGDGSPKPPKIPDRHAHANALRTGLEGAIDAERDARERWPEQLKADGVILAVEGWPNGFQLALESLDLRGSGIELLSVKLPVGDPPSAEVATVFVPDSQVAQFFSRLDRYANEETRRGTPRHERLVANIASMQRATLQQLWTDYRPYPDESSGWWEIWLRRTGQRTSHPR